MMDGNRQVSVRSKKRILFSFSLLALLLAILLFRTAWIQVVDGDELSDKAKDQQTSDIPISPHRGNIVDRNGNLLASSILSYSLWVRPPEVRLAYGKTEKREEIANELAVILAIKAEDIKNLFESDQPLVKLVSYLEKNDADKIKKLQISGLELAEGTRRYYPNGDFASAMLGSVNGDGMGVSGLELEYDRYLSGTSGREVNKTDVNGNALSFGRTRFFGAKDGCTLQTTCDEYLQTELEKAVRNGYQETRADMVQGIAIDPKTGEILAMTKMPSFDPNTPTLPTGEEDRKKMEAMSPEEQSTFITQMWRCPMISDTYEPGSTAKAITGSAALEEGLINPDSGFYCSGEIEISGLTFYDAEHKQHGQESYTQAFGNSCNPVHMQLALDLGTERYYKYLRLYGLTQASGVDYPGEAEPIISDPDQIGPVELASMGFGQSLAITPLQLLSAESAIANGGVIMKPHFMKALLDEDNKVVASYKPELVRKVLSEETASEMLGIMEEEVDTYGGHKAKIPGYRIGGKTGTANRTVNGKYDDTYNTSFISVAPIDDPAIMVLVICTAPKNYTYYADLTAIPIVKAFMEKALPYLGVEKAESDDGATGRGHTDVYVPDVTGSSYKQAIALMDECGLKYQLLPALTEEESKEENSDIVIKDQYPKAGSAAAKEDVVYLYRD